MLVSARTQVKTAIGMVHRTIYAANLQIYLHEHLHGVLHGVLAP